MAIERNQEGQRPHGYLILFDEREDPKEDSLSIRARCYVIDQFQSYGSGNYACIDHTIHGEAIRSAFADGVAVINHERGNMAHKLIQEATGQPGYAGHALISSGKFKKITEEVQRANKWARLWKSLATKLYLRKLIFRRNTKW